MNRPRWLQNVGPLLVLLLPQGVQGRHGSPGVGRDGLNLIQGARELGYQVVYTREELQDLPDGTEKILGVFLAYHTFNDQDEESLRAQGLPLYDPDAPTVEGRRWAFGIAWASFGDTLGGILAKAHGLNAHLLPLSGDNTDIHRVMYATLFGVWLPKQVAEKGGCAEDILRARAPCRRAHRNRTRGGPLHPTP